jgi:predicted ATPase
MALSRPPTPFIGRRRILADLRALLTEERLVTLLGASGMGKTRTAVELVDAQGWKLPGGVIRVDLSHADDAVGITREVAGALGLVGPTDRPRAVGEALRRRGRALLLLDNFEQLVDHAGETVGDWLANCPDLCFLVTSRERLRLPGEVTVELPPLDVPADDAGETEAAEAEALRFWIAARRRADPRYELANDDLATVAAIVRALDGIPLAIELAAARCSLLGAPELLARLTSRFEVLRHGARDASERQATMEGAIAWSWNLLDAAEQRALAQCSLFRGGFTVSSAEAIIELPDDAPPLLDVLHALRDKSLVRSLAPAPGTDAPRLGLFQSIRDFATARLRESGEAERTLRRFAAHYAELARELDRAVEGPDGPAALHRLAAEKENLLFVAGRADGGDGDAVTAAIAALAALDTILWCRGPVGAHLPLLDAAIAAAEAVKIDPAHLQRALELRGLTLGSIGKLEAAFDDLDRAVAMAEAVGDPAGLARALMGCAWTRLRVRDLDGVKELLRRSLEITREIGDQHLEGLATGSLGAVPKERGDFAGAYALYRAALDLHKQVGNRRFEGVAHTRLAILNLEHGHLAEARRSGEKALAIHRAFESRYLEGLVLTALGAANHAEGLLDQARALYAEAIPLHEAMGERRIYGSCVGYLGVSEYEAGDVEVALERLDDAYEILTGANEHRHAAMFLGFHAAIEGSLGRIESAGARLEAARALLAEHPDERFDAVLDLGGALINVAAAKHAAAAGATAADRDDTRIARARQRLAAARTGAGGADPPASRSVDVRIAARLLERELRAFAGTATAGDAGAIVVHPYGYWFALPDGEPVDVRRRHAIRRLLVKLTRQRIDRPGVPLDAKTLVDSGWPDERMSAESAQNRLYVTLNRMRKLGLRDILLATDGGYLLDPNRPVRLAPVDD